VSGVRINLLSANDARHRGLAAELAVVDADNVAGGTGPPENGGDLHVIGSTELARTVIEQDLVDEFRLMIDPITLGRGKRFLPDDDARSGSCDSSTAT
jgi:dihydrofolate reductase